MLSSRVSPCGDEPASDPQITLSDWMGKLPDRLHNNPLLWLAIPGSHDSAAFELERDELSRAVEASVWNLYSKSCCCCTNIVLRHAYNWSITQDLDFTTQLQTGVRYFDMRTCYRSEERTFYLVHGLYACTLDKALEDIVGFLRDHRREVILLDMNHFYEVSAELSAACQRVITDTFKQLLCPTTVSIDALTLEHMWRHGYQVICFYNYPGTLPAELWPGNTVRSEWPDKANSKDLLSWLDQRYARRKDNSEKIFDVYQGVLTPNAKLIVTSTLRPCHTPTLKSECADPVNPQFIEWVGTRQAGNRGIGICIVDYVSAEYSQTVIRLNYGQLATAP